MHYLALAGTKAYFEALSCDIGIPISQLVGVKKGNTLEFNQGTWAHPEVTMDFAQWASVPCRIWANRTLRSIVSSGNAQTVVSLPARPVEDRMLTLAQGLAIFGLADNPRCQAMTQDMVMGWIAKESRQQIAPSLEPAWESATEIAEALGYNPTAVQKVRSQLGKAVAYWHRSNNNGDRPYQKKRLCNGTMRPCNVYQRSGPMPKARQKGLVIASEQVDGIIYICTSGEKWMTFMEAHENINVSFTS